MEAYQNNRLEEAERLMHDAIALAEREGFNDDRLASVLNNLGVLRLEQGRTAEAGSSLERAAALYRRCDDCARGAAATLRNLSMVLRFQGRLASAEQAVREGLAKIRRLQDARTDRARLLDELGWISLYRDQPHGAANHFRRAIDELQHQATKSDYLAQLFQSLANAYFLGGEFGKAETECYRALELVDERTAPHLVAATHIRLGSVYSELGRFADAEHHLRRAETLLCTNPATSPLEMSAVHHETAVMETRRANYAAAEERFEQALTLVQSVMNPSHPEVLKLRANYAVLLRKQNRKKEAAEIDSELRALWRDRDAYEARIPTVDARDLADRAKQQRRKSR